MGNFGPEQLVLMGVIILVVIGAKVLLVRLVLGSLRSSGAASVQDGSTKISPTNHAIKPLDDTTNRSLAE